MTTTQHFAMAGADLHEPKGVSSAVAGASYLATGTGTGTWSKAPEIMTVTMADISAPSSVWIVSPLAGVITSVHCVIQTAITTANSIVTIKIGGVAVTGGTITATFSGSAAGTVYSCTPTALNTVTAGQAIEIATDGGSTVTSIATFSVTITPS